MSKFNTITKQQVEEGKFVILDILTDSFYYPSSGFDGGIIKDCNTKAQDLQISSFIYCDYGVGAESFEANKNSFAGYHIFASRHIDQSELTPNRWQQKIPPNLSPNKYSRYREHWQPFCIWTIYERDFNLGSEHGPDKFSLLYVGGEGVATYQALYWTNKITAKALAIIQPGHGFGLNWTDFSDKDGALSWVINNNPAGTPETIYYGGYGNEPAAFNWRGYTDAKRHIFPYYHGYGGMIKIYSKA